LHAQRIGRYKKGKCRPLRVKISAAEAKAEIVKRASCLKDIEDFKGIFISSDLTRKQQLVNKDLRDNVRRLKTEGYQNIKIKIVHIEKGNG